MEKVIQLEFFYKVEEDEFLELLENFCKCRFFIKNSKGDLIFFVICDMVSIEEDKIDREVGIVVNVILEYWKIDYLMYRGKVLFL